MMTDKATEQVDMSGAVKATYTESDNSMGMPIEKSTVDEAPYEGGSQQISYLREVFTRSKGRSNSD